jgi:histidine triad (HIT) family protein
VRCASGLRCEGINFFRSDGATAGEQVFHSYLNVVPRWQGDGFDFRFLAQYGAAAPRERLDDVVARLRKRLSAS